MTAPRSEILNPVSVSIDETQIKVLFNSPGVLIGMLRNKLNTLIGKNTSETYPAVYMKGNLQIELRLRDFGGSALYLKIDNLANEKVINDYLAILKQIGIDCDRITNEILLIKNKTTSPTGNPKLFAAAANNNTISVTEDDPKVNTSTLKRKRS
ncbi:MAG: hypothetical protein ABI597_12760 [Gammaproteobacteria bacterium]